MIAVVPNYLLIFLFLAKISPTSRRVPSEIHLLLKELDNQKMIHHKHRGDLTLIVSGGSRLRVQAKINQQLFQLQNCTV